MIDEIQLNKDSPAAGQRGVTLKNRVVWYWPPDFNAAQGRQRSRILAKPEKRTVL